MRYSRSQQAAIKEAIRRKNEAAIRRADWKKLEAQIKQPNIGPRYPVKVIFKREDNLS